MKSSHIIYAIGMAAILLAACANLHRHESDDNTRVLFNFKDESGWFFYHQDTATVENYMVKDGLLTLYTRANSIDRSKYHTDSIGFTTGTYTWRVNVPEIDSLTNTFVAAWLYNDDDHELDIQIGFGKQKERAGYNLAPGQLVANSLSAGHPFLASGTPVYPGWHTLSIILETNYLNNYVATWKIDDEVCQKATLDYGPEEYSFFICCSLENSAFYGDAVSSKDYSAQFDYVEFNGKIGNPDFYPYVPGEKHRYR